VILSICLLSFDYGYSQISNPESVEVVDKGGEWFVRHQISKGETLYSLSRTYSVSVDDIISNNPGSSGGVGIDEVVLIPISDKYTHSHRVEAGETIYSISSKNKVKAAELREWNTIENNELSIGQELRIFSFVEKEKSAGAGSTAFKYHTVAAGESLFSISRQYDVTVDDLIQWNDVENYTITVGQKLKVGELTIAEAPKEEITAIEQPQETPPQVIKEETQVPEEVLIVPVVVEKEEDAMLYIPEDTVDFISPLSDFGKSEERGMAELIEESAESAKYLALHRTAPNGTILTVRNELNAQVVFVRVIGPLPETGMNEKVVVKISKLAWERLGAVNKRLRVKVSYIL
jgi:LysM repeat protein